MKQTNLIVEIVLTANEPLILIRDPRTGAVLKIAASANETASFLEEVITKMENPPANN